MKRSTKIAIKYMSFVWLFTTCLGFIVNCAPQEIKDGIDGLDLAPSPYDIVEIIDPCGKQSAHDEVLLRLRDGSLLSHYSDGQKQFFLIVGPGSYKTSDGTGCYFNVSKDLVVAWGI